MSDLTVSSAVDTLMQAADQAAIKVAVGIDLASPGPIGGTTPGADTFTTLRSDSAILGTIAYADTFAIAGGSVMVSADGANILAVRNGTNAQSYRVYNTFTDASNFEVGEFDWISDPNVLTIGSSFAGSGVARNVRIKAGLSLYLSAGGFDAWRLDASAGSLLAQNDNAYDIGASGANRPRNLFIGGKLNMISIPTSPSGLSSGDVYSNAGILTIVP